VVGRLQQDVSLDRVRQAMNRHGQHVRRGDPDRPPVARRSTGQHVRTEVNPLLYLGFLITALGAGMVLYFKPQG
jgi:hypothetical protein